MTAACIALFGVSASGSSALAASVTFDFTNLMPGTSATEDTRTFSAGGLELQITSRFRDESSSGNNAVGGGRVTYRPGFGLGVDNPLGGPISRDVDAIDGDRGDEELLLTFSEEVEIASLTFADFTTGDPFANDVFFVLNPGAFGDFRSAGSQVGFFNARSNGGNGNPNAQSLPDFTVPDNQVGPRTDIRVFVQDRQTAIYLSSVTVRTQAVIPEPSSLVLLGVGGLGLLTRRRVSAGK
ncbi:MAG: PEP-CTERM sorting domain-containing protein [Planctomycetota bacterium]